jgi:hypothetical protein
MEIVTLALLVFISSRLVGKLLCDLDIWLLCGDEDEAPSATLKASILG